MRTGRSRAKPPTRITRDRRLDFRMPRARARPDHRTVTLTDLRGIRSRPGGQRRCSRRQWLRYTLSEPPAGPQALGPQRESSRGGLATTRHGLGVGQIRASWTTSSGPTTSCGCGQGGRVKWWLLAISGRHAAHHGHANRPVRDPDSAGCRRDGRGVLRPRPATPAARRPQGPHVVTPGRPAAARTLSA